MIFDRLLNRVVIDPYSGDAELASVANQLKKGNADPALVMLSNRDDIDRRADRLETLATLLQGLRALARLTSTDGATAEAFTLHGSMTLHHAWEARGSGWKPQNVPEFQRRLDLAAARLTEAAARAPHDALPWIPLVTVAKAQQRDVEDRETVFEHGRTLAPHSLALHINFRDAIARKWGGPDGLADDFVERTVAAAPTGSPLQALKAIHAVESLTEYGMMDNGGPPGMYFTRATVRRALDESESMLPAIAAKSPMYAEPLLRNYLAFAFWQSEMPARSRPHLAALKSHKRFGEAPWHLLGPAEKLIRHACRDCGV